LFKRASQRFDRAPRALEPHVGFANEPEGVGVDIRRGADTLQKVGSLCMVTAAFRVSR
jgi:hypothetical protein